MPAPTKPAVQKQWGQDRGDSRTGVDGVCPWWHEVSSRVFLNAFVDCDAAWSAWLASLGGRRKGRPVGYPRFKKRGRSRASLTITHTDSAPTICPAAAAADRVCARARERARLARGVARGRVVVQSVTISRHGQRWVASILTKTLQDVPEQASKRARQAGTVGVDVGVHHLAALSTGELVANPRHLRRAAGRLAVGQQALSRTQPDSQRREKARRTVARLHSRLAEQRAGYLHQLTKRLATGWACVAVEDLNIAGMTRRPKPKPDPDQAGAFLPNGARQGRPD